ncbi:MAG TPA: hypothetical protein VFU62_04200 [Hanamia sp.]|nr:hypothetical protein [Hanamia sp.]
MLNTNADQHYDVIVVGGRITEAKNIGLVLSPVSPPISTPLWIYLWKSGYSFL